MKFYGQFKNPQVDEYLYNTFFKTKIIGDGVCIEAGAYDGIVDSNSLFFEKHLNWKTINIEPSPILYKDLIKNRPNSINLNNAITGHSFSGKEVVFEEMLFKNSSKPIGHGYIDEIVSEVDQKAADQYNNRRGSQYVVTAISYWDLIKTLKLDYVDLLVLDIEGGEESVLKDLCLSPILPTVLCIEDNYNKLESYKKLLTLIGYEYHSKVHVNTHFILKNN